MLVLRLHIHRLDAGFILIPCKSAVRNPAEKHAKSLYFIEFLHKYNIISLHSMKCYLRYLTYDQLWPNRINHNTCTCIHFFWRSSWSSTINFILYYDVYLENGTVISWGTGFNSLGILIMWHNIMIASPMC